MQKENQDGQQLRHALMPEMTTALLSITTAISGHVTALHRPFYTC